MDCIFCKVVSKEIPSGMVYENEKALGFLDINPLNKGHSLVVPKTHYETVHEMPGDEFAELCKVVKKVADAVKKATGCDGLNIMQNNGRAAEQLVPHVHFHIIPRYEKDGLVTKWKTKKYLEGEVGAMRKRIVREL